MAGPLVFWPNRKSKTGSRSLSKVPRAHRKPFVTEPPVMRPSPSKLIRSNIDRFGTLDHPDLLAEFRADIETHLPSYLDVFDLLVGVRESLKKSRELLDNQGKFMKETGDALDLAREELRECANLKRENEALKKSDEAKTADLRKLRDLLDEDKIQLRILYAVDEACEARDAEIKTIRAELADRDSQIEELKRSKKKLREAMNRLTENT